MISRSVVRWYVGSMAIGVGSIVWIWYELGWRIALAVFGALWANNAMNEIMRRLEAERRMEMVRSMQDARRRIREMVSGLDAGSAAPGGVASAGSADDTNTEAEATRTERP